MAARIEQITGVEADDFSVLRPTETIGGREVHWHEPSLPNGPWRPEDSATRDYEGVSDPSEPGAMLALPTNVAIRFVLDRQTQEVSALVVDRDTGKVLRTIPPDRLMELIRKSGRFTGMFVEECL